MPIKSSVREYLTGSLLVFGVLCATTAAGAAPSEPDAVVREMVDKIKAASNPSPVVEYVDWKNAFDTSSPMLRQQMHVNTPEEMKSSFARMLKDPSAMMKEHFQQQLESAPAEQKQQMQQQFGQMETMMKQREQEMKDRIKETTYDIGKPVIEGDKARVQVKQTFRGESRSEEVKLVKAGNTWLLPTFMPVGGGQGGGPGPGGPHGAPSNMSPAAPGGAEPPPAPPSAPGK